MNSDEYLESKQVERERDQYAEIDAEGMQAAKAITAQSGTQAAPSLYAPSAAASSGKPSLLDLYPAKAQFASGDTVVLVAEIDNPGVEPARLELELTVMHLHRTMGTHRQSVDVEAQSAAAIRIAVGPMHVEGVLGCGADARLLRGDEEIGRLSGAFDVVSDWRLAPRYGFLSDFHPDEAGDGEDALALCKLHVNLVQFYDWMYRHDRLVSPHDPFEDLMGRTLSQQVVREKIGLCHRYGMKAIAYGAVYAASRDFYEAHPDWGLYDSGGRVLDLIDRFFIMNVSERSPWRNHIIGQYREAIEALDFDGIHMDTYGFPKAAISRLNGEARVERLEEQFPGLIDDTRQALDATGKDIALIFNNVGNWPVGAAARAAQDVVYIEIWKPYERYHHIRELIAGGKRDGGGKPVILAAYLKPFRDEPAEAAQSAALLLTAVIAAHGGGHLLLGERYGALTVAYYADYAPLPETFVRTMRTYCDFIVRYHNLLFDRDLVDVSMTHADGDNLEYVVENVPCSAYGEPDRVWAVLREKPGLKTVHLINLVGNDDRWNAGKREPQTQENIRVAIQVEERVRFVLLATPDEEMGRPREAEYAIEDGPRGKRVVVTVPRLRCWTMLAVELDKDVPFG